MTENTGSVPRRENKLPQMNSSRYHCPHLGCGAFAHQIKGDVWFRLEGSDQPKMEEGWQVHRCQACGKATLWQFWERREKPQIILWTMVFPLTPEGPQANEDMPEEARAVYLEAQRVAPLSKRSAAALLRLTLQIVIDGLVPGSKSINGKIAILVERGLLPQVQQAMDVLRIVGNNAAHPGQIDLDEEPDLVDGLFILVNLVVEQMISRPKHAQTLYDSLPEQAREQIARRDGTGADTA